MVEYQKRLKIVFFGSDDEEIKFSYDDGYEKYSHKKLLKGNKQHEEDISKQIVIGKKKFHNINLILNVKM